MLDSKLLLARSITVLFRENVLKAETDNSIDLVRRIIKDVHIPEHSLGVNEDRTTLLALKQMATGMCDNFSEEFVKEDLVQQAHIACSGDTQLFDAIKGALEADFDETALKKSVLTIRKQLDHHFRTKEISEAFRKASADINFNSEKIQDLFQYVQEFTAKVDPLCATSEFKDPAILGVIDFSNREDVQSVFQNLKSEVGGARIYRTGFKGFNEMSDGGLHVPESSMNLSLPHNYKTGFSLTVYSQVMQYNIPKTVDKKKIPCMLRISFEDELPDIMKFLFMQMRYTETRELVVFEDYETEFVTEYVMSRLEKNGWEAHIIRVDPTRWSYKDVFNYVTNMEAKGYSVEGLWLDYMGLLPTTGCIQGNAGEALRDMLRRFRNFCASKGILFHTPHQLSTEAKTLLRNGTSPSMFVKDIAERGFSAGSKQLDQELDLEFYHHKFSHGKEWYLAVQRGKHRGHMIVDEKKFFILKFPTNLMPIPDDINDDSPVLRRIGATSSVSKEDEALLL